MRAASLVLAFLCLSVWVSDACAKRSPPEDVAPVSYQGVKYQVVHYKTDNGQQNGGYVEAISEKDGKKKWARLLYLVEYDPDLEQDVQDCFIKSMRLDSKKKKLIVTSEAGHLYYMDLNTQQVTHVVPGRRQE